MAGGLRNAEKQSLFGLILSYSPRAGEEFEQPRGDCRFEMSSAHAWHTKASLSDAARAKDSRWGGLMTKRSTRGRRNCCHRVVVESFLGKPEWRERVTVQSPREECRSGHRCGVGKVRADAVPLGDERLKRTLIRT